MNTLALTLAVMCLSAPATAGDSAVARFGKPLKGLKPTPLSEVLLSPKDGDTVRLEGKAETVCRNKGCWVTVREGDATVHVTFEGYSFFIPKDSAGRNVVLEGKVKVKGARAGRDRALEGRGGRKGGGVARLRRSLRGRAAGLHPLIAAQATGG